MANACCCNLPGDPTGITMTFVISDSKHMYFPFVEKLLILFFIVISYHQIYFTVSIIKCMDIDFISNFFVVYHMMYRGFI